MKGASNWAVTVGAHGVTFAPAPGNTGMTPPEVEMMAVLPTESKVIATLQQPVDDVDPSAYGFVFDQPLPEGSVIYLNGSVLATI